MNNVAFGLVPVFNASYKAGDHTVLDITEKDITLDFLKQYFFENIDFNWRWSNADGASLSRYISILIDMFCDDHEKIAHAQLMLLTCIREIGFCSFVLEGTKKFENFYYENDHKYRLTLSLEGLVTALSSELSKLPPDCTALKPFMNHCETYQSSETFVGMQKFNKDFMLPMEFTCYIGQFWNQHSYVCQHVRGKHYSDDSTFFRGLIQSDLDLHEVSCRLHTQNGIVDAAVLLPEPGEPTALRPTLKGLTVGEIIHILGVNLDTFIHEIIPETKDPLKLVLLIEREKNGYTLSATLEETPLGSYLKRNDHNRKIPETVTLEHDSLVETLKTPRKRTPAQTALIGVTKKIFQKDSDGLSSYIYAMKSSYFFSSHFKKYQSEVDEFGKFLLELRYIAFMAQEFSLISRMTPLIFPSLLPKEENRTELIDARNPTLVLGKEGPYETVPNNVLIDASKRIQMVTGPNKNGKSRYIDSIALNQICCQAGWPVFAKKATMSPKTDLRIHYVHSGVGISGESRFSHECERMRTVFQGMDGPYPLILIDEPYTGTNHQDAEVLLKELLQACSDEDISVFLTTHFHELIPFIEEMSNGRNLHCYVDEAGTFTFQIREGASTLTNALDVGREAKVRFEQLIEIIRLRKSPPPPQEPVPGEVDDLPF